MLDDGTGKYFTREFEARPDFGKNISKISSSDERGAWILDSASTLRGVHSPAIPLAVTQISPRQRPHYPTRLTQVNHSEQFEAQMAARCSFASSGPPTASFTPTQIG